MDDNNQLLQECSPPKRARRSTYKEITINQDDTYDSDAMSDSNYDPLQDNDQNSENDERVSRGSAAAQKAIRKVLVSGNSLNAVNPTLADVDDQSKCSNYLVWNHDGLASFVSFSHKVEATLITDC